MLVNAHLVWQAQARLIVAIFQLAKGEIDRRPVVPTPQPRYHPSFRDS